MRFGLVMMAAACGTMLGCRTDAATAPRAALTIVVPAASLVGLRSPVNPPGGFGGQAVLRNTTQLAVRVNACGPDVEREVRLGEWETVLRRYCTMQLDLSDIEVPAMSELSVGWAAWAPLAGTGADLTGRYRLVYRYRVDGYLDDPEEARSAPFDVED